MDPLYKVEMHFEQKLLIFSLFSDFHNLAFAYHSTYIYIF